MIYQPTSSFTIVLRLLEVVPRCLEDGAIIWAIHSPHLDVRFFSQTTTGTDLLPQSCETCEGVLDRSNILSLEDHKLIRQEDSQVFSFALNLSLILRQRYSETSKGLEFRYQPEVTSKFRMMQTSFSSRSKQNNPTAKEFIYLGVQNASLTMEHLQWLVKWHATRDVSSKSRMQCAIDLTS